MLKKPIVSALFLFGLILQPLMAADAAKLTLTVEGKLTSEKAKEPKDPKPKEGGKREVSQKTLEVHISSLSPKDPGPLKVKCSFLARDLGTKANVVHKEIILDAQLERSHAVVKTEPVTFDNSAAYTKKGGEKVEASGQDYRGFEVLVMNSAGEIIGKAYSSRAIQEEIDKKAKP